ncbi:MAG: sensor histidine kinase [Oscillospiraceae bacterium]|nr:sensor histidine kinase [Oscillospiraceae bacterium]
MKLFKEYIKGRRKGITAFSLFSAVFFATFALYRLPMKAVLYPTLLCLIIGIIFISLDFSRSKRKHRQLSEIKELTAAMMSSMPDIESVDDKDYQDIIKSLQNEISNLQTMTSARYRDMTEYYTVWVHQIKTPIASMRLTLQNEDTPLSRKLSSDLFKIEQYVEMVLAFLRLESVSNDYVFKEYSIDAVIKQAVAKFASEFIDRRIRLIYEPVDVTVITDEKWLSFVIEQILSNALKYTREGSIKIYMRESKTLCIEDTGIGIAPEDLPRIFEKGYTGYNGRTDKKASGIGLYLCKRICKNLGAEISVTSKPDIGTTVSINLEQYELKRE